VHLLNCIFLITPSFRNHLPHLCSQLCNFERSERLSS
jgi:hypothetical protein